MRKDMVFDHATTNFQLEGRHRTVDCRACHSTLVFGEAETDCVSCHTDVHQQTVGQDCARCHHTENWLVDDISGIHQDNGFPLVGAHAAAQCFDCHVSESDLRFDRLGNDCISCHREDYQGTTNPNHQEAGFSLQCADCHDPVRFGWESGPVEHDFFPLTKGHDIADCGQCHTGGDFTQTPTDCAACHQADFDATSQPSHTMAGFPTDCRMCHTTDPGWMPAEFRDHDGLYFPVYSGAHEGTWSSCTECHQNQGDFGEFTCLTCHQPQETDDEHQGIGGYIYQSQACLACHPTGNADDIFDHNATAFPLTGAHVDVDCAACHGGGFQGTPTECAACHMPAFDQTNNPDHGDLGFPADCAACHTTAPDWTPAGMPDHDAYYALNGAHALIRDDCSSCHHGDYNNTPNTCWGCHQNDFQNTLDPDHEALNFSTDCITCHTESAWSPTAFDHDGQYFPIYSGQHEGEWMSCTDCHNNPSQYADFTCLTCHLNPETDDQHQGILGYVYASTACLACHPTGSADDVFDHNQTGFSLTGAHLTTDCLECHAGGFSGTPTACNACHSEDFNQAGNPNHVALGLPMDCASCHSTEPGWSPAQFPDHDNYYALVGAHAMIAMDCAACHNGDYQNTPNTCAGCHQEDYDQTNDPNHASLQFSTDCASCHNESAWEPSSFDHDGQYFPINSGAHAGEWTTCTDCHMNPGDWADFTCLTCHLNPETEDQHQGVQGFVYVSTACLACHPTGSADDIFDHDQTGFALTGAHQQADCLDCHAGGFAGTPTACSACHLEDFNQAVNPNHMTLGLPMDCASCHSTEPGWSPAQFPDHDSYYPLLGAHAMIAMDCAACHNGDYQNTPNTCAGCHLEDFQQTTDPDHEAAQFNTDCASCHSENAWSPAQFDHDGQYFPIYSGKHEGEWSQCTDCHTDPGNYATFSCTGCHVNPETDDHHAGIPGYSYSSPSCLACHPTGSADDPFDHSQTNFPLTGAHVSVSCIECHAGGYQGTPMNCDACHLGDFNQASNPNHLTLGLSTDCMTCHTTDPGWSPASFPVHNDFWVIDGAHIPVANECALCHNGDYNNTPNTCSGCHLPDYNQSVNPDHGALGFPTDCATCHTTDPGWSPAEFPQHNDYWVIDGAHVPIAQDCAACHNGDYQNTPNTCAGCHQEDYNQSLNPNHISLGLPMDCAQCHTTAPDWMPATFPLHDAYWPITGAHTAIANDCAACHGGDYNNTPNTCYGCHTEDYNQTSNPDHQAAQFPTDCTQCHNQDAWTPATLDHNLFWPLTGAHAAIANDCNACHNGNYNNTPNACSACHTDDYNQSANPSHASLGLPMDCAMCHTTDPDWMPATFPIHDDFWPLTGAHAAIANECSTCHNGNYNNTPNTCYGCHMADYNGTNNPDHAAAGFPTTCENCHTTSAWTPSNWDHDSQYFPIYSGKHDGEWNQCTDCHTVPGNYAIFSCIDCHQHDDPAEVGDDHQGVPGYSYNSQACYDCHPTGED